MISANADPYDPRSARYLCFATERARFAAAQSTPRAFLEACLARIEAAEPAVKAFVSLDPIGARAAADRSTQRWRDGRPLSRVDGLPVGIKDCFDVQGTPTRVNSPLFDDAPLAAIDAAHVDALRRGGALIVGKTVTTELTMAEPGPTWNPWDLRRTPGGSSSGSAAAVAARMLPIATGSQVRGSCLRPSSICGVIGMKPTYGALNRQGAFDPQPSLNHLGLLAGTLTDLWDTALQIVAEAGGDPGCPPLAGGPDLPLARPPRTLARQYTAGWPLTDAASQAAFEVFLDRLRGAGVNVLEPAASAELAAYEDATARAPEFFFDVMNWESRWLVRALAERKPGGLSPTMQARMDEDRLTVADYRLALEHRAALRGLHRGLAGAIDGCITLGHIGPGQIGQPLSGTPWFNDPSSAIGAPTLNLPLLSVEGVPLGVQIMGFEGADADLVSMARWLMEHFGPQGPGLV